MSSSAEARVLRGDDAAAVVSSAHVADLRARVSRGPIAVPGAGGWRASSAGDLREAVREEARAAGFAAGWAEGRQAAAAEAQARVAAEQAELAAQLEVAEQSVGRALTALAAAVSHVERQSVAPLAEISDAVLSAAFALAEAIVGREVVTATNPGADALRRALDLSPLHRPVVVRLHPDDLLALGPSGTTLDVDGRTVTLIADHAVSRGGAIAECDATRVDAQLDTALARAREVLGL